MWPTTKKPFLTQSFEITDFCFLFVWFCLFCLTRSWSSSWLRLLVAENDFEYRVRPLFYSYWSGRSAPHTWFMYSIRLSVGKNCTSGSRPIAGSSSFSQAFLLQLLSVCESFIKHQLDWQLIISLFLYIHRVLKLFLPSIFVNSLISPSWLCFFVQSFLLTWLIIPSTPFLSICLEHIHMQVVFWSSFFSSQNQPHFLYLDVYIDISLFQHVKCLLFLLFYLIHFPFLQCECPRLLNCLLYC